MQAQLGQRIGAEVGEQARPDHGGDAREAEQGAGELARRHPFVAGEPMGNEHAPDRRRRVEDRSEAAGDVGLAPAEQSEGQSIVEQSEQQDRAPCRTRQSEPLAPHLEKQPHAAGGDRQPQPDIAQRVDVADGDADEQEGATPDQGEEQQDGPFAADHLLVDHRRTMAARARTRVPRLAFKQAGDARRHLSQLESEASSRQQKAVAGQ
jgi:hypothetical protein